MKTRSALLRSIGVLVALLMFTALPNSVLGELCDPAHEPDCELVYGHGTLLYLKLITDCPTAATIFYTRTFNTPNTVDPTHTGATPGYLTYSVPNGTLIPTLWQHHIHPDACLETEHGRFGHRKL